MNEEELRRLVQYVQVLHEINKRTKTVPLPTEEEWENEQKIMKKDKK